MKGLYRCVCWGMGWLGLATSVGTAHAQFVDIPSVQNPNMFMWGEAPPLWVDDLIYTTAHINVYWGSTVRGAHREFGSLAANGPEWAAEAVIRNLVLGEVGGVVTQNPAPAGKICIILEGVGIDSWAFDEYPASRDREHRWFRENTTTASSGTPSLPNGDSIESILPGYLESDTSEGRSAKPFKHPLVINSGLVPLPGSGVNGPYEVAPMRVWMDRFCAQYASIQASPTSVGLPSGTVVPDPAAWYFDAEPHSVGVPANNSMLMLKKLEQHWRWTGMKLPGDPLGRTPAQAFVDARDDAAQQGSIWPTIAGLVINNNQRGADQVPNRDLMSWWYTCAQRAQDAVMDYAVYTPIRNRWPNAKFGNYDDAMTDGVTDRTGWMQNPPTNFTWVGGPSSECIDRSDANVNKSAMFPRVNLSKFRGSSFVPVYTGSANPSVWLGIESRASGSIDQPLLYPVSEYGYDGNCYMQVPGNKQIEQYDPLRAVSFPFARPWETQQETSMRLARHLVESTIHSTVGNTVGSENRVVPWVQMAGADAGGYASLENFQMRGHTREMMAMLRGKRLSSAAFWTPWNRSSLAREGEPITTLWDAWTDTQDCAHRVYANRVYKYTRTYSTFSSLYGPYDKDRLEYTLSNDETLAGGSKIRAEVGIKSKSLPVPVPQTEPPTPAVYKTEMVVDYEYVDMWPLAAVDGGQDSVYLDLRVECSTDVAGVRGMIFVYDWAVTSGNPWRQVDTYDAYDPNTGAPLYLCHTDVVGGRYENRRRFEIQAYQFSVDPQTFRPGWYGVDTDGRKKTRVKYVHLADSAFWSWYDLTQVIASPTADPGSISSNLAMNMPLSDVNYDGFVNESDLSTYLEEWMNGEPSADLNADTAVENDDLGTFVEAYTTGT